MTVTCNYDRLRVPFIEPTYHGFRDSDVDYAAIIAEFPRLERVNRQFINNILEREGYQKHYWKKIRFALKGAVAKHNWGVMSRLNTNKRGPKAGSKTIKTLVQDFVID